MPRVARREGKSPFPRAAPLILFKDRTILDSNPSRVSIGLIQNERGKSG